MKRIPTSKLTSAQVLSTVSIVGTIAADICYVVLPKKLIYDKPKKERKKEDYIIAYGVPTAISVGSMIAGGMSNKQYRKELITLLGVHAGYAMTEDAYRRATAEEVDEETIKRIETKADPEEEKDLEKLMIECDSADDNEIGTRLDKRRWYFKQLRLLVYATTDEMDAALMSLNTEIWLKPEVSIEWFFDQVDPEIKKTEIYKQNVGEDGKEIGWVADMPNPADQYGSIDIVTYTRKMSDGRDVTTVNFLPQPLYFKEWQEYLERMWRDNEERRVIEHQEKW